MGYKLFRVGFFEKAGDLKIAWGEKDLELKQAAPGTFFAVVGSLVIAISIAKGINYSFSSIPGETTAATRPSKQSILWKGSGFGGGASSVPLSAAIRHALSDYALCTIANGSDDGIRACDATLREKDLQAVPDRNDLWDIEQLEATPAADRNDEWKSEIAALRQRFLRPSMK